MVSCEHALGMHHPDYGPRRQSSRDVPHHAPETITANTSPCYLTSDICIPNTCSTSLILYDQQSSSNKYYNNSKQGGINNTLRS